MPNALLRFFISLKSPFVIGPRAGLTFFGETWETKTGGGNIPSPVRHLLIRLLDYFLAALAALAFSLAIFSSRTACAAANLATGTRKGLQLT